MNRCWHKWLEWSTPFTTKTERSGDFGVPYNYSATLQVKACGKCGKTKSRLIHLGIGEPKHE